VAAFVVGRHLAVLFLDDLRFALQPHVDLVFGVLEVLYLKPLLAALGGEQCSLVHQVLEVGPENPACPWPRS